MGLRAAHKLTEKHTSAFSKMCVTTAGETLSHSMAFGIHKMVGVIYHKTLPLLLIFVNEWIQFFDSVNNRKKGKADQTIQKFCEPI